MVLCTGHFGVRMAVLLVAGLVCSDGSESPRATSQGQSSLTSSCLADPTSPPGVPVRNLERLSPDGQDLRIAVDRLGRVYCAWSESEFFSEKSVLRMRVKQGEQVWSLAWAGVHDAIVKDLFSLLGTVEPFRVIKVTRTKETGTLGGYSWDGVLDVYDLDPVPTTTSGTPRAPSASYRCSVSLPALDFGDILQSWFWEILPIPGEVDRYLLLAKYDEKSIRDLLDLLHPTYFPKCCSAILDTKTGRTVNVLALAKKGPPQHVEPLAACMDPLGTAHVILWIWDPAEVVSKTWGPTEFPGKLSLATLGPKGWIRRDLEADRYPDPLLAAGGSRAFIAWHHKGRWYLAPLGPGGPGPPTQVSVGRVEALAVSPAGEPHLLWTDSTSRDNWYVSVFAGQKLRSAVQLVFPEPPYQVGMAVDAHNEVHLVWRHGEEVPGERIARYPVYYGRVELPSVAPAP